MFFNANGLSLRIEDVKRFATREQIDLSFIVETHYFKNQYPTGPEFIHVSPAYTGPNDGKIGGISLVLHGNYVQRRNVRILNQSKYWIIINLFGDIIAACYFPPSLELPRLLIEMLDLLQHLSDNWSKSVTIVGDFNARHKDFGDHITSNRGTQLSEILNEAPFLRCEPELGCWTSFGRGDNGGHGVTDLLLYNHQSPSNFIICETESLGGSDHRPLVWDFNLLEPYSPKTPSWNWERFRKDTSLIVDYQKILLETQPVFKNPTHVTETFQELVDTEWVTITNWIKSALTSTCGKKRPFRFHEDMFWTPELLKESKKIDYYANRQSILPERKVLCKRYLKNLQKRREETKRLILDELCRSANRNKFFKHVKKINRKYTPNGLSTGRLNDYVEYFKTTFGSKPT